MRFGANYARSHASRNTCYFQQCVLHIQKCTINIWNCSFVFETDRSIRKSIFVSSNTKIKNVYLDTSGSNFIVTGTGGTTLQIRYTIQFHDVHWDCQQLKAQFSLTPIMSFKGTKTHITKNSQAELSCKQCDHYKY